MHFGKLEESHLKVLILNLKKMEFSIIKLI